MAKVSTYLKQRLGKVGFNETDMQAVQTVFDAIDRNAEKVAIKFKGGASEKVTTLYALQCVFGQEVESVTIPRKPRELSEETKKKRYEAKLEELRKKYGYYDKN